jgi:hypothetical protein
MLHLYTITNAPIYDNVTRQPTTEKVAKGTKVELANFAEIIEADSVYDERASEYELQPYGQQAEEPVILRQCILPSGVPVLLNKKDLDAHLELDF